MTVVDLWCEEPQASPIVDAKKEKKPKQSKESELDLSSLYVVAAGINKATNRQLFLSTFEDCDEWSISIVPSIMSRDKALHMMELAQQYITDNPQRYRHRPPILAIESLSNPDIYKQVRCILR